MRIYVLGITMDTQCCPVAAITASREPNSGEQRTTQSLGLNIDVQKARWVTKTGEGGGSSAPRRGKRGDVLGPAGGGGICPLSKPGLMTTLRPQRREGPNRGGIFFRASEPRWRAIHSSFHADQTSMEKAMSAAVARTVSLAAICAAIRRRAYRG